nr:mitofilin family membrane protein [Rhodovulum imhoffii]
MLRIAAALDSGESFDDALTDLGNTEIPEALSGVAQDGAPSLADLRSTFPSAARAALAESLRETAETEPAGRFTAFLRSQLGARSLAPREGDDPDAVLSRAEAAVDSGDLDQAIGELATLPQAGQDAMADWVAAASARIEALAAARSLYESLNSN